MKLKNSTFYEENFCQKLIIGTCEKVVLDK